MLGGPLIQKYGVYLDRVTVAHPRYEYESRLREMLPGAFQNLRLMALDPYDLALPNSNATSNATVPAIYCESYDSAEAKKAGAGDK